MSIRGFRRVALHTTMVALVVLSTSSDRSLAQAPLADGDYTIDVVDLPVLGAPRAVALGGAYGSIGEGISAAPWNPAAVATRARHETDWFEWELSLGALFPTDGNSNRFFGRTSDGGVRTDSFRFFDVGFRLQFGPAAFGVLVRPRVFDTVDSLGNRETFSSQTAHIDFAWQFFHGDLVVGAGVRAANVSVEDRLVSTGKTRELLQITGANAEFGATYRPHDRPFRASAVVRLPIRAQSIEADASVAGTPYVPRSVTLPWELALSGTFGFGERPLSSLTPTTYRRHARRRLERETRERRAACVANGMVLPTDPRPEGSTPPEGVDVLPIEPVIPVGCDEFRPRPLGPEPPRPRYGLVTAELVIAGRTPDAIGFDGYITQTNRQWGAHATVSPRVGLEGEPWRNRMKLRGGFYREPGRSTLADARGHFTTGFDLRLFDWDIFGLLDEAMGFQVTGTGDFAPGYITFGVGVGIWH